MPCIAHTRHSDHHGRQESRLANLSDRVLRYELSEDDRARLRHIEEGYHHCNKSMYDDYLLGKCHQIGAAWIALIEDDVLARDGWYTRVSRLADDPWLYLRIFYTVDLLDWNSGECPSLPWQVFACPLALLLLLIGARIKYPRLRRNLSIVNAAVLCLVSLLSCIILYFMVGRVTMQPFIAGVHETNCSGCCSQGFIFPRAIISQLVERTKKAIDEDYYIDMLQVRLADVKHSERFVLIPSLLQHVGGKSSKGWGCDESVGNILMASMFAVVAGRRHMPLLTYPLTSHLRPRGVYIAGRPAITSEG